MRTACETLPVRDRRTFSKRTARFFLVSVPLFVWPCLPWETPSLYSRLHSNSEAKAVGSVGVPVFSPK